MYNILIYLDILREIRMLKNIIIISLFLFIVSPLFAQIPPAQNQQENLLTYTPSKDYTEPQYMWGVNREYKNGYKAKFALSTILDGNVLPFFITEEDAQEKPTNISDKQLAAKNALENTLEKRRREKELSTIITESFQVWFDDTKAAIEEAGRQDEFSDIMPILDRPIKTKKVNKDIMDYYPDAVIKFYFTNEQTMHSKCGSDTARGCAANRKVRTVSPYSGNPYFTKELVKKILIHEIGHIYGLIDQYKNTGDSDTTYATTDRFIRRKSVMGADYSAHLQCDDIDGFINLIDLTLYLQNGTWSNSAKRGWASFCNGKKDFKDTFYKKAKVLNKQDYRDEGQKGDQCVYTYTAEGKIDQKYCPKLWSFARPKDKLTYGTNGLLTNKKDEKFNYNYSYVRKQGVPSVKVTITNSGAQHTSSRKIVDGKNTWELPIGYYSYIHVPNGYYDYRNNNRYIQLDKQNCNIVNFVPFSDKKGYSLDFVNDKLQPEYTYSFLVVGRELAMRKNLSKENRVCAVLWYEDEMIKFEKRSSSEELTIKQKDEDSLNEFAKLEGKTKSQLIDRLKTECKKDLHQSIIDNARALCSYFRKVDNYFGR